MNAHLLPRVGRNTDIVEDFLKAISIKEFSCFIKLLWDIEDTLGKKIKQLYIAFTFFSEGQDC